MNTEVGWSTTPRPVQGQVMCPHKGGAHRINYVDWNRDNGSGHVLICLHGVTRNSRDFDFLGQALAGHARVVSIDYAGHGDSEWLADTRLYQDGMWDMCIADVLTVMDALSIEKASFVGTSMGGYIASLLACRYPGRTESLIVNDTSPVLQKKYLTYLTMLFADDVSFPTREEFGKFLRYYLKDWGEIGPAQWEHIVAHGLRTASDGGFSMAFDPRLMTLPYVWVRVDLRPLWRELAVPVLIIRGAQSTFLDRDRFLEMLQYGPNYFGVEFGGCGHAPSLMHPEHHAAMRTWMGFLAARKGSPGHQYERLQGVFENGFVNSAAL